jgi:SHAQKYF class myb-like DNA-binding protein
MFIVSTISDYKNKDATKKQHIKQKKSELKASPPKSEEKSPIFINSPLNYSLQTNISSYSGKGSFLNSFTIDQNVPENNQEKNDSNFFLNKKRKFKVNYISNDKEKTLNENYKPIVKEKKNKKENIFSSTEIKGENEGRWNDDEHVKFLEAINIYGNNWREVQKYVKTRSSNQVRSHAQKFILKLKTFKDSSLGIDFTGNSVKNLTDIIEKIKEIEKFNNNNNILLLLNQKLSEKNMKSNGFNKKEKNKEVILFKNGIKENNNSYINLKNISQKKDKNSLNIIKSLENENMNIISNENEMVKNSCINKKKIDNRYLDNEKNIKDEDKSKKEMEEKNLYFDYEDKNYLNNHYEIFDDIVYEINKDEIPFYIPKKYDLKELNTISIINKTYYC